MNGPTDDGREPETGYAARIRDAINLKTIACAIACGLLGVMFAVWLSRYL